MGGYGVQSMKVIKVNRALLKKSRSFRELRKDYMDHTHKTKLQFKELTEGERKKIRAAIIAQVRKNRTQEVIYYIMALIGTICLLYAIYYFARS
ncbi:hypothetical protein SAMN04488009_2555 [Maribacter sedimenticola]|uniref:Uncharacterized protein n=2 Tax=Maribacter sedimenticola TaxID=228956 RepID=A0ABY1SID0_9FLAO|nr:hypothetical protein SAMN04488009_2555 [Maribacter sedimenticola]